jgi:hypothetical protein
MTTLSTNKALSTKSGKACNSYKPIQVIRHLSRTFAKEFQPGEYRRDSIATTIFMFGIAIGTILVCLLF